MEIFIKIILKLQNLLDPPTFMSFGPYSSSPRGQCWKATEKSLPRETQLLVTSSEFSALVDKGEKRLFFQGFNSFAKSCSLRQYNMPH